EQRPWPETGRPRRAAVSSFGISGTNAHVIIEEPQVFIGDPAPVPAVPEDEPLVDGGVVPWVLSGRSPAAVRAQAARLGEWIRARPGLGTADVGLSLVTIRELFDCRAVVTGRSVKELLTGLAAVADDVESAGVVTGSAAGGEDREVAWAFSGQGSQWVGMGRGLYRAFPIFARAWDRVMDLLDGLSNLDHRLSDVVWAEPGSPAAVLLDQTGYAQPALFALQVALVELVRSWSIRPSHMVGHSVGEIAAAWASGVLSLEDACRLVVVRSGLMQQLPQGGAMVAVEAGEEVVAEVVAAAGPGVSIAAVNGPSSVVVAGDAVAVEQVVRALGVRSRKLRVSHAFHSPLMDPMLDELGAALHAADLSWGTPQVPLISAVTGEPVGDDVVGSPEYWVRHARDAVRFADAMARLREDGVSRVLEIGPDTTLSALISSVLPGWSVLDDAVAVGMLGRDRDELTTSVTALAALMVSGVEVDWARIYGRAETVALPTYAFQGRRYWPESVITAGGADALVLDESSDADPEPSVADSLRGRLAATPEAERAGTVLDLVRSHIAAALGHASSAEVGSDQKFTELGFTSLTAVELRNRLVKAVGMALPATLVFDLPTPRAIAKYLLAEFVDGGTVAEEPTVVTVQPSDDPIVIVGMACRLPGGVDSPDEFWDLVRDGVDVVSAFPDDRGWDLADLADTSVTSSGGFLPGLANFDAGFFGISPREALAMDPQQRLLLEISWEAIERAGIDADTLRGSRTGVFAGSSSETYSHLLLASGHELDGLVSVSNATSVLSGRVAYSFGFEGPAVTVDTACSSSLVAL
ncbi:acyltransferase domain-containing protein, partial [Amycolatopsis sp. NPDC004368]